jgi:hypothetical protein
MDPTRHGHNRALNTGAVQAAASAGPSMLGALQSVFGSTSKATASAAHPASSANPIGTGHPSAFNQRLPNPFPVQNARGIHADPVVGPEINGLKASHGMNVAPDTTGSPAYSDEGYGSDGAEVEW